MYVNKRINQKSMLKFVQKFKEIGSLQQFGLIHNNEVMVKFAVKPYEENDIKQLFSISKSFTAIAIGMAVDNRLIDIHDKVINFFPYNLPKVISENLAKMEIYHLLTMTTGHSECTMARMSMCSDPIKGFFEAPLPYSPGTKFTYNTGASLILSVIINIVTGMSLDEYLRPLFKALGINSYYYEKIGDICLGGVGLHLDINALLAFGKFLLNEGKVDGKQIVSKEFIKLATSKQVDNDENGTLDWSQGYGFQIWMGEEGFRCDGAAGQLIIVYPNRNMVIAVQAEVDNMQAEVNLIKALINDLFGNEIIDDLEFRINDVYPVLSTNEFPYNSLSIKLNSNDLNLESLEIIKDNALLMLIFNGENSFSIKAGNGDYEKSSFYATGIKKKISAVMPVYYEESIVSCYYLFENNRLEVVMKNHNTPYVQSIDIEFDDNIVGLTINGKKISGDIINKDDI